MAGMACIYSTPFSPPSPQMLMSALVTIMVFVIRYATTMLVATPAPVELDIHRVDFLHAQVCVLIKIKWDTAPGSPFDQGFITVKLTCYSMHTKEVLLLMQRHCGEGEAFAS